MFPQVIALKRLTIVGMVIAPRYENEEQHLLIGEIMNKEDIQIILAALAAYCNTKSTLLVALVRAVGLKARMHFSGIHSVNCMLDGMPTGQPKPPRLFTWMLKRFVKKANITGVQLNVWAGLLSFELGIWRHKGWLYARSFQDFADHDDLLPLVVSSRDGDRARSSWNA